MSNIVHLEPDPHAAVQQLLPWYLNGRLAPAEHAQVEEHLAGCAACRAELQAEGLWRSLPAPGAVPADPEAGWARLRERLAQAPGAAPATTRPGLARPPGSGLPRRMAHLGRALVPAGLSLAAGLAIGWGLARPAVPGLPAAAAAYHALAAPAVPTGTAVVRFRAEATEVQIRASLEACGARIVDGPTATGAYVLQVPREGYARTLARLRAQPAVALAEALDGGPAP